MPKCKVLSGDLDTEVTAESHKESAALALQEAQELADSNTPLPTLAFAVEVFEIVSDPIYVRTEPLLQELKLLA